VLTPGTPSVTGSVAFLPSAFRERYFQLDPTIGEFPEFPVVGHCLRYLINIFRPHIKGVPFTCVGKAELMVITTT